MIDEVYAGYVPGMKKRISHYANRPDLQPPVRNPISHVLPAPKIKKPGAGKCQKRKSAGVIAIIKEWQKRNYPKISVEKEIKMLAVDKKMEAKGKELQAKRKWEEEQKAIGEGTKKIKWAEEEKQQAKGTREEFDKNRLSGEKAWMRKKTRGEAGQESKVTEEKEQKARIALEEMERRATESKKGAGGNNMHQLTMPKVKVRPSYSRPLLEMFTHIPDLQLSEDEEIKEEQKKDGGKNNKLQLTMPKVNVRPSYSRPLLEMFTHIPDLQLSEDDED